MPKCKVIHNKEIRKNNDNGRSTLWIRIEVDKDMDIAPGCNINVFPMNLVENEDPSKIIEFNEVRGKVPFPAMPLSELHKILDLKQNASDKQVKMAMLMATCDEAKKQAVLTKSKEKDGITLK